MPELILPNRLKREKKNYIETPRIGIKGIVAKWEVVNPDGSIAQSCHKPKSNYILNTGLDFVGTYDIRSCFAYLAVGTGSSAPAAGQTGLDSETTYGGTTRPAASGYSAYDSEDLPAEAESPWLITYAKGIQTDVGKLNGTFTELGFGPTSARGANLWSRFLIKDEYGDPTSVTITSVQQLRLQYILLIELAPNGTQTGLTFDVDGYGDGVGYGCRWCCINQSSTYGSGKDFIYTLGGPGGSTNYCYAGTSVSPSYLNIDNSSPSTPDANGTVTRESYTPGSYERYEQYAFTTTGVYGNISYIHRGQRAGAGTQVAPYWMAIFDSAIVKPDTHNLSFRVKYSWARG